LTARASGRKLTSSPQKAAGNTGSSDGIPGYLSRYLAEADSPRLYRRVT
jgi:hypothetical protein